MGLLTWVLVGLIAAALGKIFVPGPDKGGIPWLLAVGVMGALLGAGVASALGFGGIAEVDPRSVTVAFLGAALLVVLVRMFQRARRS